jgi:hypothetical protein
MEKRRNLLLNAYLFYAQQEATTFGQSRADAKRVADMFYREYVLSFDA